MACIFHFVIPAQAGIQGSKHVACDSWIPAFAGMTRRYLLSGRSFGSFLGDRVGVGFDEAARLTVPEFGVLAAEREQLGVGPLFDDGATIEHDEPVECRDGGQTMR